MEPENHRKKSSKVLIIGWILGRQFEIRKFNVNADETLVNYSQFLELASYQQWALEVNRYANCLVQLDIKMQNHM